MGLISHRTCLLVQMDHLILYLLLEPFIITILMIYLPLPLPEQRYLISKMGFCYTLPQMVIPIPHTRRILICCH